MPLLPMRLFRLDCSTRCGMADTTKTTNEKGAAKESPRMARCGYYGKRCKSERPSSEKANLAFFQETPDRDYDDYYCGCYGWN